MKTVLPDQAPSLPRGSGCGVCRSQSVSQISLQARGRARRPSSLPPPGRSLWLCPCPPSGRTGRALWSATRWIKRRLFLEDHNFQLGSASLHLHLLPHGLPPSPASPPAPLLSPLTADPGPLPSSVDPPSQESSLCPNVTCPCCEAALPHLQLLSLLRAIAFQGQWATGLSTRTPS